MAKMKKSKSPLAGRVNDPHEKGAKTREAAIKLVSMKKKTRSADAVKNLKKK